MQYSTLVHPSASLQMALEPFIHTSIAFLTVRIHESTNRAKRSLMRSLWKSVRVWGSKFTHESNIGLHPIEDGSM